MIVPRKMCESGCCDLRGTEINFITRTILDVCIRKNSCNVIVSIVRRQLSIDIARLLGDTVIKIKFHVNLRSTWCYVRQNNLCLT